eukprot:377847_1
MEFEPLFLEIEHKIGKLEKMAQRFTGVTESVDEFQRRIEKESRQQQSINRALFDLKRKQDAEAERIRRGLSPQQARMEEEKAWERERKSTKAFNDKREELNRQHNERMAYLHREYGSSKKRGSEVLEPDMYMRRQLTQHRDTDDDDDDDIDDGMRSPMSDLSQSTDTHTTGTHEARKLESREHLKRQRTVNQLKQRQDIRSEQERMVREEKKWCRKHCNFLYKAEDLEYKFKENFKLTSVDFDKINRIGKHPMDFRVDFIKELNRAVLIKEEKTEDDRGHVRSHEVANKQRNSAIDAYTPRSNRRNTSNTQRRTSSLAKQLLQRRSLSILSTKQLSTDMNYPGALPLSQKFSFEEEDEHEEGVFHIRYNGVCTFTAYDSKLHRTRPEKLKLKDDIAVNTIKGKRITIARYVDRMSYNEQVTCWIALDTYLQNCLENTHGLRSINVYGDEEEDDEMSNDTDDLEYSTYHAIFMSKRISLRRSYEGQRIVVLCPQHKKHIRHGLWSRTISLCGNLAFGTMLNYIYTGATLNKHAQKHPQWTHKRFDYIIAEPNCFVTTQAEHSACPTGSFPVIASHNNSSRAHFEWLWDKYLVHKPRAQIFWIGHCEGCDDIKYLLSVRPSAAERTAGIVFMDYGIDSAAKDLAAVPPSANGINNTSNRIPNPGYSRFFNGKTDNWFIKPFVVETPKYPKTEAYDWTKEERGDFWDSDALGEAPVVLLYSVNVNWRFTPCLSMYIVNKYLLSRGIVDNEWIWRSPQEKNKEMDRRAAQNHGNYDAVSPSQAFMGSRQSSDDVSNVYDRNMEEKKEDAMDVELNQYTTIPDHLLPAAHEQGPIQIRTNEVFSQLPPMLVTMDQVKEKKMEEIMREKRKLDAIEERMIQAMQEQIWTDEGDEGEDEETKKKNRKKRRKDKKKKRNKKDKKKKKKKKGGDSDDGDSDD